MSIPLTGFFNSTMPETHQAAFDTDIARVVMYYVYSTCICGKKNLSF